MLTSDFDYDLPPELIAQQPIEPRDASRLMVVHRGDGQLEHRHFYDIVDYLRAGDVLVANETRVIPARIQARKVPSGGHVELLLLARRAPTVWESLVKGRRVDVGQRLALLRDGEPVVEGVVRAIAASGGRIIEFAEPVDDLLDSLGSVPLPPYIHQPLGDTERYQTVYARQRGSVAAPTAGLHFTPALIERVRQMGVIWATIVLHIGLDTFRPVSEEQVEDHQIHTESCWLNEETAAIINAAKAEGRRVIAVGTTAVRALETAARGQTMGVVPWAGDTDLFIYPGYQFRVVDALITNLHLPRSSLLMLISALAGRELIRNAYAEAIRERYRFYSLGDSMLIL
ncbi:MAG: tRNA preQ1(34) S-adenosylmethionine ribosyltransferase-isomerase QueA [Anaerolineales bacterium]